MQFKRLQSPSDCPVACTSNCSVETLEARKLLSGITPADYDYLSNLRPMSQENGFGPYQRDRSNGEDGGADGAALSVNGRAYRKGLGVHASSELHFLLNGNYNTFVSDIGLDDEVGINGSVVFQVFADHEKLYDSGVMTGGMSPRRINVDVSGMNELALIVTDAGDGNVDDHADWGGARLVRPVGDLPAVTSPADIHLDQVRSFFTGAGSFTDTGVGPYVSTVDWGDGTAREYLTPDDNNNFSLNHWFPARNEPYTVTTRINNGSATGFSSFKVYVENVPPSSVGLVGPTDSNGAFTAFSGLTFRSGGTFSDPGTFAGDETYTAAIDFGDGTPLIHVPVDGRFFETQHVFMNTGTFNVTTTITDSNGGVGIGSSAVNVVAPNFTYLSDQPAVSQAGNARNDRAVNGSRLYMNGKRFVKGIGVSANSELVYDLSSKYTNLIADVGIDDSVDGSNSALQFQIYADGQLVFDTGTMTESRGTKRVNLDVRGVNELRLVVTHAGDRASANDFGDWGNIRVA